jgi:hypothetical protein
LEQHLAAMLEGEEVRLPTSPSPAQGHEGRVARIGPSYRSVRRRVCGLGQD